MVDRILLDSLIKIVVFTGLIMTAAAYFVLIERRMAAWVQDRLGPNRVGIPLTKIRLFGMGQPLADGLKMLFKEEYTPAHVNRPLYNLAPIMILATALAVYATVPFGSLLPGSELWGEKPVELVVAPGVEIGIIYVFALSSIAVYGVIVGGWSSNNKYSFLGGLRSSAQMISYELPLGLGILGVVLASSTLDLNTVITEQASSGVWYAFQQPLGFVVFVIAAFAEAARLPFDLPEAEQELVGGYHTEYSGMRLTMFLTAEFIHMITASFLIVILFLGGWHFWGITGAGSEITWATAVLRIAVFAFKIVLMILFFMLVRWSWPRFRFDQLMTLAWKIMLPLGIVNFVIVAVLLEINAIWGEQLAFPPVLLTIVGGWIVLFASWAVVAWSRPLVTDNRPRLETSPAEPPYWSQGPGATP